MNDAVCISDNSVGTSLLRWDGINRSPVQAIGSTSPTLDNDSIAFTYNNTSGNIVAYVKIGSSAAKSVNVVEPSTFRTIAEINGSTLAVTMLATHANQFVIYNPTSPAVTGQQITVCTGLPAGTEVEIFNATANPLTIIPNASGGGYAAGNILSVGSNKNSVAYGCAVLKVWKTGDSSSAPTYLLIGALSA